VPGYFRAPAHNSDAGFIAALAGLVMKARAGGSGLCSAGGGRLCPAKHLDCPMRLAS
jgi:ferrochelatase